MKLLNYFVIVVILLILSISAIAHDGEEIKAEQMDANFLSEQEDISQLNSEELAKATGLRSITFARVEGIKYTEDNYFVLKDGTKINKGQLQDKDVVFFEGGVKIADTEIKTNNINAGEIKFSEDRLMIGDFNIDAVEGMNVEVKAEDEIVVKDVENLEFNGLDIVGEKSDQGIGYRLIKRANGDLGVVLETGNNLKIKNQNVEAHLTTETAKYYSMDNGNKQGINGEGKLNVKEGAAIKSIYSEDNPIIILEDNKIKKAVLGYSEIETNIETNGFYAETSGGERKEIQTTKGSASIYFDDYDDIEVIGAKIRVKENKVYVPQQTIDDDQSIVVKANRNKIKIQDNNFVQETWGTLDNLDYDLDVVLEEHTIHMNKNGDVDAEKGETSIYSKNKQDSGFSGIGGAYVHISELDRVYKIGQISSYYESRDDAGAISPRKEYGIYQLTKGRAASFLKKFPAYGEQFKGLDPGTDEFDKKWKQVAKKDNTVFSEAQYKFIKKTHYDVMADNVNKDTGLNVNVKSPAIQEMVWSTAVQFGPGSNVINSALKGEDVSSLSEQEIINAVSAEKLKRNDDGALAYFKSSDKKVQEAVANRFVNEKKNLLSLADNYAEE